MSKKNGYFLKNLLLVTGAVIISSGLTAFFIMQNDAFEITNAPNLTSYNNLVVTGTPINNGEFISGGGTYRDVNLKLRINVPVGWSLSLGGSGCTCEDEFETAAHLNISRNDSQNQPQGQPFSSQVLDDYISINRSEYGVNEVYSSFEDVVNNFISMKDDEKVSSVTQESFLLVNKYKSERFDIVYKAGAFNDEEENISSPEQFRTITIVEFNNGVYSIDTRNTDFYNSEQVQEMLNSIEFYE